MPPERELKRVVRRGRQARGGVVERVGEVRKEITITGNLTVQELADLLNVRGTDVIKRLMARGIMASVNQGLDVDMAALLAQDLGSVPTVAIPERAEAAKAQIAGVASRPPVITVMGHVDHGKTSLLDAIRETKVTDQEAGGITQHIGASRVEWRGRDIIFLDTPGHEAFTAMRARGAKVTDIAVLVVAADDGVMPQTVEALNHARAAKVPVVVAINKIDKPGSEPDRVKRELADLGLLPEEWGGDTVMVPVSAKTRDGLQDLLEMLLLVADLQDLRADPDAVAVGTIVEAQLDRGRGPVATVLILNGTLRVGDTIVAGSTCGRVRALFDDRGRRLDDAGPSTPVEVLGLELVPEAGDSLQVTADDKTARDLAARQTEVAHARDADVANRLRLDDIHKRISEGQVKDLNLVVKADVQGSAEAVAQALAKVSHAEVRVNVIHAGVGAITESDVMLAAASGAIVIGFNVRPDSGAKRASDQNHVDIRTYRIIYEAVDDIKAAITGMLKPIIRDVVVGHATVRAAFKLPKGGFVAGCYVTDGKMVKNSPVRVLRDNIVIHEGRVDSLKRFKDDVREVTAGYECGMGVSGYSDVREGDVFEAVGKEEVPR
ncbi:MAG: translation initiation factor IF-2 [Bacillota bacterium]